MHANKGNKLILFEGKTQRFHENANVLLAFQIGSHWHWCSGYAETNSNQGTWSTIDENSQAVKELLTLTDVVFQLDNLVKSSSWDTNSLFSAPDHLLHLHHGQLKEITYHCFLVTLKVCFYLLLIKTNCLQKRSINVGENRCILWSLCFFFIGVVLFLSNERHMALHHFWMTMHPWYPGLLLLPRKTTEPSSIFWLSAQLQCLGVEQWF